MNGQLGRLVYSSRSSSSSSSDESNSEDEMSVEQPKRGRGTGRFGLLDRLRGSRQASQKVKKQRSNMLDALQNLRVRTRTNIADDETVRSEVPSIASTTASSFNSFNSQRSKASNFSSGDPRIQMKYQDHTFPSLSTTFTSSSMTISRGMGKKAAPPMLSEPKINSGNTVSTPFCTPLLHAVNSGAPKHVIQDIAMKSLVSEEVAMHMHGNLLPLHSAIERYDTKMEVVLHILALNPQAASIRDVNGLNSVDLLWKRYIDPDDYRSEEVKQTAAFLRSRMEEVVSPKFTMNQQSRAHCMLHDLPEFSEFWNTISILIQTASSPTVATTSKSPKLLHACVGVECNPLLIRFAAALHPEQILEFVDCHRRVLLHVAASKSPEVFKAVLNLSRRAVARTDDFGRLPLHYALENGKTWSDGISDLIKEYPKSLSVKDPTTGLPPCLGAACTQSPDLNTIFSIMTMNPVEFTSLASG
jgi:hypothetical protein